MCKVAVIIRLLAIQPLNCERTKNCVLLNLTSSDPQFMLFYRLLIFEDIRRRLPLPLLSKLSWGLPLILLVINFELLATMDVLVDFNSRLSHLLQTWRAVSRGALASGIRSKPERGYVPICRSVRLLDGSGSKLLISFGLYRIVIF